MNELIKHKLEALPQESGVYVMREKTGQVIYVGKAKNLKNRVSQYFFATKKDDKVAAMVQNIYDLEYFVTPAEVDALALENTLIKKYKPFYNILLKDDKSFSYIKVNLKEDFPKFEVTRKIKNDGKKYFGPFFAGITAFEILKILNLAYPIQTYGLKVSRSSKQESKDTTFAFSFGSMFNKIKLTKDEYKVVVDKTIKFLNGDNEEIEQILTDKMLANAKMENFEQALLLRDKIAKLKKLREKTIINVPRNLSVDAFGASSNGLETAVSVVVYRMGRIVGIQNFSLLSLSEDVNEILAEFIVEYYKDKLLPKEILVPNKLQFEKSIEQTLFEQKGTKVEIIAPEKSLKKKFVGMALDNSALHLKTSVSKQQQKQNATIGAIKRLKEKLELKNLPYRMECYDISNLGGTNSVSSMAVFTNGEADKKSYRKFKIKTVDGPNDFLSMQETLTRRLERLVSGDTDFGAKPDLIVIDGGKGQLSAAHEILCKFGLEGQIDMISLAKKFEEVFKPNNSFPYMLNRNSPELKLLQKLRDETHRFAITFHRTLRDKNAFTSVLDDLEGLGEKKAKLLFEKFLSVQKIKEASKEELMQVNGIGQKLAEKIINFLKDK